jgi:hypothetical protein
VSPEWVRFRAWLDDFNHVQRIRAASHDVSVAARWSEIGPPHDELERRRWPWLADPEWTPPLLAHRGGHYAGGPVQWKTGAPA